MIAAKVARRRPMSDQRHVPAAQAVRGLSEDLTPLRAAVLEALQDAGVCLGAYEISDHLRSRLGRRIAPHSIYRILDHLCQSGLVARLETSKAFVARADPSAP